MKNQKITNLITEELKKSDVIDIIKNDKNFEKIVRKIVKDVVVDMYKMMYQHSSIFNTLCK